MAMRCCKKNCDRQNDQLGVSMLELAILLPLLMILIAGMIDIGMKINMVKTVTDASRHAARIAAAHAKGVGAAPACGAEVVTLCPAGKNAEPISAASVTEVAHQAACNYLKSHGLEATDWLVTVPPPAVVNEDGSLFSVLSVTIDREKRNCLFCYDKHFAALRTRSTSSFVLEGRCS